MTHMTGNLKIIAPKIAIAIAILGKWLQLDYFCNLFNTDVIYIIFEQVLTCHLWCVQDGETRRPLCCLLRVSECEQSEPLGGPQWSALWDQNLAGRWKKIFENVTNVLISIIYLIYCKSFDSCKCTGVWGCTCTVYFCLGCPLSTTQTRKARTHTHRDSCTEHFWELDEEPGCPVLHQLSMTWLTPPHFNVALFLGG